MDNFRDTILSQYANSPILNQLLEDMNGYVDPSANIDLFYSMVMDLDTAGTYGLDVWGRIVGVTRVVQVPVLPLLFGFAEVGKYIAVGFAETGASGHFWDGSSPVYQPYSLLNADYLILILAKGLYNITNGSVPAINQILLNLFPGRGNAWVSDDGSMSMTYHFTFVLTAIEYAIITQSGALPKPVGVTAQVVTP